MRCVFPASFDPVTLGHVDLIKRASALFDGVDVVVMDSHAKRYMFPAQVRLEMVKRAIQEIPGAKAVEMVFLPTKQELFHISSSVAREVILHGHRDIAKYVPKEILPVLEKSRKGE